MWNPFIEVRRELMKIDNDTYSENNDNRAQECFRKPVTGLTEKENSILTRIELPGIDKKDIELNITTEYIEVKAEKNSEVKSEDCYSSCITKFYRKFAIPGDVDPENATAIYKNGVLTVEVPKGKKKQIDIQ